VAAGDLVFRLLTLSLAVIIKNVVLKLWALNFLGSANVYYSRRDFNGRGSSRGGYRLIPSARLVNAGC
jgi:hypothetical protein